jgi:hypothetical protein
MKLPKLERYNQIVWSVVGTGLLMIAALMLIVGFAAMLSSLLKPERGAMPVTMVEDGTDGSPRQAALYDFCQPVSVYGTPYQFIRVVSDRFVVRNTPVARRSKSKGYDSYSSEAPSYETCDIHGSDHPSAMVNVLVRHTGNGVVHLMLKENAVIHTFEYPQPPNSEKYQDTAPLFPPPGVLYWEIAFEDSNGDYVIDERDDLGAYLSGPDGRDLVRITPKPSRVLEKTYDGKRNILVLRIVRDTNMDKALDDQDTPSLMEVNVAQRKMTSEVLDAARLIEFMRAAEPKRQTQHAP